MFWTILSTGLRVTGRRQNKDTSPALFKNLQECENDGKCTVNHQAPDKDHLTLLTEKKQPSGSSICWILRDEQEQILGIDTALFSLHMQL